MASKHIRRSVLSNTNELVSVVGLGCMSFTPFLPHELPRDENEVLKTLDTAVEYGVNLLNTAHFYGINGANEEFIGRAIKKHGRDKFFIVSKFGAIRNEAGHLVAFDASPAYVRKFCEESLKNLGTDYIDVYLPARVDPKTPIEETIKALVELKNEGKIKHIGLSEASASTIRRAHAVHPITLVESEFSLWETELRKEVIPTLRELGIALLAYSPLGRGFLTGEIQKVEDLPATDLRHRFPRFWPENFPHNIELLRKVEEIAKRKNVAPSQLAVAWVLAQGPDFYPIPGTKRADKLVENLGGVDVTLTAEELEEIESILREFEPKGTRYPAEGMKTVNK